MNHYYYNWKILHLYQLFEMKNMIYLETQDQRWFWIIFKTNSGIVFLEKNFLIQVILKSNFHFLEIITFKDWNLTGKPD